MPVCIYGDALVCVGACMCRPEMGVRSLSKLLSTVFIETGSLCWTQSSPIWSMNLTSLFLCSTWVLEFMMVANWAWHLCECWESKLHFSHGGSNPLTLSPMSPAQWHTLSWQKFLVWYHWLTNTAVEIYVGVSVTFRGHLVISRRQTMQGKCQPFEVDLKVEPIARWLYEQINFLIQTSHMKL